MIDKKYTPHLVTLCMALSMGLMMSFVMTATNVGFTHDFLIKWMVSFGGGVLIGVPTALIISPYILKLVQYVTK